MSILLPTDWKLLPAWLRVATIENSLTIVLLGSLSLMFFFRRWLTARSAGVSGSLSSGPALNWIVNASALLVVARFSFQPNLLGVNAVLMLLIVSLFVINFRAIESVNLPRLGPWFFPTLLLCGVLIHSTFRVMTGVTYESYADVSASLALAILATMTIRSPSSVGRISGPNLIFTQLVVWIAYFFSLFYQIRSAAFVVLCVICVQSFVLRASIPKKLFVAILQVSAALLAWRLIVSRRVFYDGALLDSGRVEFYYSPVLGDGISLLGGGFGRSREAILSATGGAESNVHSSWVALVGDAGGALAALIIFSGFLGLYFFGSPPSLSHPVLSRWHRLPALAMFFFIGSVNSGLETLPITLALLIYVLSEAKPYGMRGNPSTEEIPKWGRPPKVPDNSRRPSR